MKIHISKKYQKILAIKKLVKIKRRNFINRIKENFTTKPRKSRETLSKSLYNKLSQNLINEIINFASSEKMIITWQNIKIFQYSLVLMLVTLYLERKHHRERQCYGIKITFDLKLRFFYDNYRCK